MIDRELPHADIVRPESSPDGLYRASFVVDGDEIGAISNVAFAAPTGSFLYGTDHPDSDYDIKAVYLETFERILLDGDRPVRRFESSEGHAEANRPGDVDVECIELRKFVRDALDGHPYAIEMLHVPRSIELLRTDLWEELLRRRERLVSAQVDPFVGYCRAQVRRYANKADRLSAIESVLDVLESADRGARIETVVDRLPTDSEHVGVVEQPIRGQERPVKLLRVVDKQYELRARVSKAVDSLRSLRESYGERVRDAAEGTPDWKAISHAYRIAFELRELLETGALDFPLERAPFLGEVRRGEIPYRRVERELPELVEEALETPTDLPDTPDESFWLDWLVETYASRVPSP